MQGDAITDLTIAMEVNYFQLNRAEYFFRYREDSGKRAGAAWGADHTLIDFISKIKEEYGNTVQNIRDRMDIKFTRPLEGENLMHLRQVSGGEFGLFHPRGNLLFEFIETAPQRAWE
jgi:hypothetical protein